MIGVGLRTGQRAVQLQVNLFDDGMGQIVDGPQFLLGVQVPVISLFQSQFHGKVTASQIHKIVHPCTMNSMVLMPVVVGWMVTMR